MIMYIIPTTSVSVRNFRDIPAYQRSIDVRLERTESLWRFSPTFHPFRRRDSVLSIAAERGVGERSLSVDIDASQRLLPTGSWLSTKWTKIMKKIA